MSISPLFYIAPSLAVPKTATVPGSFAAWPKKTPSITSPEIARPAEF